MQDNYHPWSQKVKPSLYLSTVALLCEAQWIQQNSAMVYMNIWWSIGHDKDCEDTNNMLQLTKNPTNKDIKSLVDSILSMQPKQ